VVRTTDTLQEYLRKFMKISRSILLRNGNVSDKRCKENKTQAFYVHFCCSENHAV